MDKQMLWVKTAESSYVVVHYDDIAVLDWYLAATGGVRGDIATNRDYLHFYFPQIDLTLGEGGQHGG